MIELNDGMRNLSSQCLRLIKCSVIIQFASPRKLAHPMHSHKAALLSTRCKAKHSQQNSTPQTRCFQPEITLGNTKLYCLFPFRSEKCSLDRSTFHRVTFWPLLCLPACPNPVFCQFYFKIDMIPGAVVASSTTSCLFGRTVYRRERSLLPAVAMNLLLWSPRPFTFSMWDPAVLLDYSVLDLDAELLR